MNFFVIDFEFTFYKRPVGRPRGFFNEIIEAGAVLLEQKAGGKAPWFFQRNHRGRRCFA